jgi:hypothetical protein
MVYNILNFIYKLLLLFIIEIINHNHYIIITIKLLAPRFLGGRENLPLLDICASNLGISSTVLLSKGGEAVCQEQLDNKITGICTMIFTGLCVAIIIWLPSIFNFIKKLFELPKKKKERIENNKSIIILAKILQACRKRKTTTGK